MSFESLGLRAELLSAVSEKGYSTPSPIQRQAIPLVLEGRDIMGSAETGTGKTAGFVLPSLERLMSFGKPEKGPRAIRALMLAPTRELAAQVADSVFEYSKHLPLRSTAVFGGVSIYQQIRKLHKGVDILIATPGRLLDHVRQGNVDLSRVEILVLDEADRMLDMGFIPDIRTIITLVPKERQTLLFSATLSNAIKKLSKELLKSPALVEVAGSNSVAKNVTQLIHPVDKIRKRELLSYLIGSKDWRQVLVFSRTKDGADRLTKQLIIDGIKATAIHGNKHQGARTRALADFKSGKVRVLVATDVAARGLDIHQLPHVVNFDLPDVAEDYIHRIGRTGRAGNEGAAMSLVCVDELHLLRNIQGLMQREIKQEVIEGFEPDPSIRAKPQSKRRGRQQSGKKYGQRKSGPSSGSNQGNQHSRFKGRSNNPSANNRSSQRSRKAS